MPNCRTILPEKSLYFSAFIRLFSLNLSKHQFCFVFLLFLAAVSAYAEPISPGPAVIKVDSHRELQEVTIRKMLQGRKGFIWFATNQGLWRYDGGNLKKYQHKNDDPSGLPTDALTGLVEDPQGYLWVVNQNKGLSRFDPVTEQYVHLTHQPNDINSLSTNTLTGMHIDKQGQLWLGSVNGINIVDTKSFAVKRVDLDMTTLDGTKEGPYVFHAFPDSYGNVWMTVRRKGFFRYDKKLNRLIQLHSKPDDPTTKDPGLPQNVYETRDGTVWVTSNNAVNRYDEARGIFKRIYSKQTDGASSQPSPTVLIETRKGEMLLGTFEEGLAVINQTQSAFELFNPHKLFHKDSIDVQNIHDLMQDRAGNIWASGYPRGLYKIPEASFDIRFHLADIEEREVFESTYAPSGRDIFIGTSERLLEYHVDTQQFDTLMSEGAVTSMVEGEQGVLYVFVSGKGVYQVDLSTEEVSPIIIPGTNQVLMHDHYNVREMIYNKGKLYFGMYARSGVQPGLISYDLRLKKLIEHNSSYTAARVAVWKDSILFGSSTQGVHIMDIKTEQWRKLTPDSLDNNYIWSILVTKTEDVWFSIENIGIAKLEADSDELNIISKSDGLHSNNISSMSEDSQGNLWLGSTEGVSVLTPSTMHFEHFGINDGFRGKGDFIYWNSASDSDDLMMGGYKWLISFNAAKVLARRQQQSASAPILLSDFRLFNKTQTTQSLDVLSPLTKTINNLDEITLNYDDSWFSLAFASSNYAMGDRLRYAYQMKGLSDKWIEADKGNQMVNFSSLSAKNYTLNIRSGDDNGWHDNIRALKVKVLPPWWQTWQAYLTYLVLLIGGAYGFYRYRTLALVKRAEALEQGIAERTETINQLMAQKDRMFANISHEFKTPLTLILNPLENINRNLDGTDFERKVSMMKRNSKRLLRMVDQLLELSKLETTENHKRDSYSLEETLNVLLTSFQPLVDSKNMTMSCCDYDDVILSLKPDSLEIILTNLISNAIKYTPNNGEININVRKFDDKVEIAVCDSGIGIDEDNQKVVFNRFTRAEDLHGESIPGAGIGLALVKELVENHNGTITLESALGEGSTFTVTLPVAEQEQAAETQVVSELSHSSMLEIDALNASTPVTADEQYVVNDDNRQTILLIDDNVDMLELLQATLSGKFNCIAAQNGTNGLALAREHLPDLVISDVMMPGISGFEVVRALKQDELTSHLPVVLLTAKGDTQSRIKGWSEKADEYLEKPFNSEELLMRIDNLLDIRRLLRQRLMREFSELNGQAAQIRIQLRDDVDSDVEQNAQNEKEQNALNIVNQRFLERINGILEDNYQDESMDVAFLANELAISPRQLSRKMKAVLDLSPVESIRSFRLKKAATLLAQGHSPSVVAHQVGFSSHSYFSKCFKAQYNCLPSSFN